jgi:hypothetical protein
MCLANVPFGYILISNNLRIQLPDLFDFLNWWGGTNTKNQISLATVVTIADYGYSA